MTYAIKVEGLGKRYTIKGGYKRRTDTLRDEIMGLFKKQKERSTAREFWALRELGFEIAEGDKVGIIGKNGAGKSTLLKLLSRVSEPTTGEIRVRGRVSSLLEVGTGFHPELSGRENIFLNGVVLGMTRGEVRRKFDEIVEFAGVADFLDTQVKHYSSGMYMRLAFSVAAHLDPDILIVDEVLAVGDIEFQKKCLGKIQKISATGRTVIFVSHSMSAVEKLCNRAIFLQNGTLYMDSRDVPSVVSEYMHQGGRSDFVSNWTSSNGSTDNDWFCPRSIRLTDEKGEEIGKTVSYLDAIYCEIDAEVIALDSALTIGIALFNEEGQCLFWSYPTDAPEDLWPRFHIGANKMRVRLPLEILKGGAYRVELIGGLHFRQWLFEPEVNAPKVFFNLNERVSESPYWMLSRIGLIAPKLTWTIN